MSHRQDPSSSSPWSVEHYGFTDHREQPDIGTTSTAGAESRPAAATASARSRPARGRALLATAALALGLTAGGAGFAAAQASAGDGGRRGDHVVVATADQGPQGGRGHRGGPR
jgi:hypothetical protein